MANSKIMVQGQWLRLVDNGDDTFSLPAAVFGDASLEKTVYAASLATAPAAAGYGLGWFLIITTATLPIYVCDGTAWVEVAI